MLIPSTRFLVHSLCLNFQGRVPESFSGKMDGLLPRPAISCGPMSQSVCVLGFLLVADFGILIIIVINICHDCNQFLPKVPYVVNQMSPLQKPVESPQHLPPSLQLQTPVTTSFAHSQTSRPPLGPVSQAQISHSSGQSSFNQALPPPRYPASHAQGPQSTSTKGQLSVNSHSQSLNMSALGNQQQQLLQPHHQSPSQFAQMLSQQTQTLQASFQSSQQAFSQLQQQLQLIQPNQGGTAQQGLQFNKQQVV